MIVLDTHIWIWWVHGAGDLTDEQRATLRDSEADGLGVSIISCWEVAKLVEHDRLKLPCPVDEWLEIALSYPGIRLLELTPRIVVESTRLPGFHRDPADQLIVATARVHGWSIVTSDEKIVHFEGVSVVGG